MKKQDKSSIIETPIEGLYFINKPTYYDNRGWFREVLRINEIEKEIGIKFKFRQWSHSFSKPRVIRALHSEEQNKIVYPITGKAFSVYVDIRPKSKTFAKVFTKEFSEPNNEAVYISEGIANSICVIGNKSVHYLYLIDQYYHPDRVRGIAWDDPDLNIKWPVKNPIISERDKNNPRLRDIFPDKFKDK